MEKSLADKVITDYMKKIYNFALSKTMNIDTAEELASRITFEVYLALLKTDDIQNINGYIYRIARNVHSRFIFEEKTNKQLLFHESHNSRIVDFNNDEACLRIRREIAYLGNTQRKIIVMFYFEKLNLKEIAKRINLPDATVRWHLYDARNHIKSGFDEKDELLTSGKQEIVFSQITHI